YCSGLLAIGDAAGFTLSTGFRVEGVNYGIASGIAAAEAVKSAKERKDFSHRGLAIYRNFLKEQGVLGDFEQFRHAPEMFKISRLYQEYPDIACQFGQALFGVEPEPKKGVFTMLKGELKGKISWPQLARDLFAGWKGLS
ncbi:MAG: FAD-dependent oxidoreductase, partial [Desulfuromonadales bacterium]|nr:FAD-dependent oxidoreductase [Desulfuromonadales bacterium]